MKVLHITSIGLNRKADGMAEVTTKYLNYQNKYIDTYLINIKETTQINHNNFYIMEPKNINAFVKNKNINLVVFHGIYHYKYIKIYKTLNVPYIIVSHGSLTRHAQRKSYIKKKVANFIFFKRFIKNSKRIHFLNQYEKYNSILSKNSYVIPNGVELNKEIKMKYNTKGNIKLTFIGRKDIRTKGLNYLIREVNRVSQEIPNLNIKLFGPEQKKTKNYINSYITTKKLDKIIENHGAVYGDEKDKVYSETDIFILTSRNEGHPTVVMEALSNGIPVIVTKNTGMGEFIEKYKCGWVIPFKKHALSNILVQISKLGYSEEMKKNSLKCASNEFDWDKITIRTINKYKEILNEVKS